MFCGRRKNVKRSDAIERHLSLKRKKSMVFFIG
jgi:hypothetical protein